MKFLFYLIIFFITVSCSTNKVTYWCGDHPCINKKEKEAYFKKTMIVEIKEIKKETSKNKSEIEKIIQQAQVVGEKTIKKEKNIVKQAKLEKKMRIKEEKKLAKKVKLDEKDLAKQMKRNKNKIIKEEKETSKHSGKVASALDDITMDTTYFEKIAKKIMRKNIFRPYPDINDIPD